MERTWPLTNLIIPNQLKGNSATPITTKSTMPEETIPLMPVIFSTPLAKSTIRGLRVAANIIISNMSGNAANTSPVLVIRESTLPLK
jgi:hypothetical protein